ncbi:MAG: SGNH/GDSL hydrolase family protein, partial [Verrucomicrobiae bacterium]|nr:SGNH/GDSL hydrolase family protein [Verrucomicrobiae bacterium]
MDKISPERTFQFFHIRSLFLLVFAILPGWVVAQKNQVFELFDGDRIVFVGNTFVERAIDYGQIEAALTTQWPQRKFTFRNLGWSGDDPRGRSRRFFGTVEDGFNHLQTHVEGLAPTVIFVAYGAMESYAGQEGLGDFEKNMEHLLGMLEKTKARIVILSPCPQEQLPPPMPKVDEHNRNLELYARSLENIARKHRYRFIDLFSLMKSSIADPNTQLTDNGVHLNDTGYKVAAEFILKGMGISNTPNSLAVSARGGLVASTGLNVSQVKPLRNGVLVTLKQDRLRAESPITVRIQDLFSGSYTLRLNGRNLGTYSAQRWASGVEIPWTPDMEQAALLLDTIKAKNELYFHKWRP